MFFNIHYHVGWDDWTAVDYHKAMNFEALSEIKI